MPARNKKSAIVDHQPAIEPGGTSACCCRSLCAANASAASPAGRLTTSTGRAKLCLPSVRAACVVVRPRQMPFDFLRGDRPPRIRPTEDPKCFALLRAGGAGGGGPCLSGPPAPTLITRRTLATDRHPSSSRRPRGTTMEDSRRSVVVLPPPAWPAARARWATHWVLTHAATRLHRYERTATYERKAAKDGVRRCWQRARLFFLLSSTGRRRARCCVDDARMRTRTDGRGRTGGRTNRRTDGRMVGLLKHASYDESNSGIPSVRHHRFTMDGEEGREK